MTVPVVWEGPVGVAEVVVIFIELVPGHFSCREEVLKGGVEVSINFSGEDAEEEHVRNRIIGVVAAFSAARDEPGPDCPGSGVAYCLGWVGMVGGSLPGVVVAVGVAAALAACLGVVARGGEAAADAAAALAVRVGRGCDMVLPGEKCGGGVWLLVSREIERDGVACRGVGLGGRLAR